jgi:hypothetical protein
MNQGPKWILLMKKTRAVKSRATVPLLGFIRTEYGSHAHDNPPAIISLPPAFLWGSRNFLYEDLIFVNCCYKYYKYIKKSFVVVQGSSR